MAARRRSACRAGEGGWEVKVKVGGEGGREGSEPGCPATRILHAQTTPLGRVRDGVTKWLEAGGRKRGVPENVGKRVAGWIMVRAIAQPAVECAAEAKFLGRAGNSETRCTYMGVRPPTMVVKRTARFLQQEKVFLDNKRLFSSGTSRYDGRCRLMRCYIPKSVPSPRHKAASWQAGKLETRPASIRKGLSHIEARLCRARGTLHRDAGKRGCPRQKQQTFTLT